VVEDIVFKEGASVYNYQENKKNFLKIYVALPSYVAQLRKLFEINHFSKFLGVDVPFETVTYESNMPFALRFMIDKDIAGMQWIQIP
jgi:DNA polymerase delta subunit 1